MKGIKVGSLVWIFVGALSTSPAWAQSDTLPAPLARALANYRLDPNAVTLAVDDLTTGRPVWRYRADVPTSPASTAKVLTTGVALDTLGPDARFVTTFYLDSEPKEGVVKRLYIRGGGDPALVLERWYLMLLALRNQGIHTIEGPVIRDVSRYHFEKEPSPGAFDGQGGRAYNLTPDPLLVNYQYLSLTLTPKQHQVDVRMTPPVPGVVVPKHMTLGAGRCENWRDQIGFKWLDGSRVELQGQLPAACGERIFNVVIPNRASYGKAFFAGMWKELGGQWHGNWVTGTIPPSAKEILSFESEPLFDLVKKTNKFSNNVMARHLFLELDPATPKTEDGAREALYRRLKAIGMPMRGFVIENGSGLSRRSRVTASGMVAFLKWAASRPYAPELMASLPVTGVDGTMKKREVAPGWGRIKTGFLGDVRAIAGFVKGEDGHLYAVFANVTGHANVAQGIPFLDAVIAWVYARPTSAPKGSTPPKASKHSSSTAKGK